MASREPRTLDRKCRCNGVRLGSWRRLKACSFLSHLLGCCPHRQMSLWGKKVNLIELPFTWIWGDMNRRGSPASPDSFNPLCRAGYYEGPVLLLVRPGRWLPRHSGWWLGLSSSEAWGVFYELTVVLGRSSAAQDWGVTASVPIELCRSSI